MLVVKRCLIFALIQNVIKFRQQLVKKYLI